MAVLLKLKEDFKKLTGADAPASGGATARKKEEKKPAVKKVEQEHATGGGHTDGKKQTK